MILKRITTRKWQTNNGIDIIELIKYGNVLGVAIGSHISPLSCTVAVEFQCYAVLIPTQAIVVQFTPYNMIGFCFTATQQKKPNKYEMFSVFHIVESSSCKITQYDGKYLL
jgi:hypothetical protein